MKSLIAIAIVASSVTGCTSYGHTRFDPTSGKPIEETHLRAPWLTKTTIAGLKTKVSETNANGKYSRQVGVETADAVTDAEGINALTRMLGQAALTALSASSGTPPRLVPVPAPADPTIFQVK